MRSAPQVAERIRTDPRWPRPGRYPRARSRVYDPLKPCDWLPLDGERLDRRAGAGRVRRIFDQPELFGIYEYEATIRKSRKKRHTKKGTVTRKVHVRDAFIGLRPSSDYDLALRIKRSHLEKRGVGTGTHKQTGHYLMQVVRCAVVMPDGTRCGRKATPVPAGRYTPKYLTACNGVHEGWAISQPLLDAAVLDVVLDAYAPEKIEAMVGQVRKDERARRSEVDELKGRLAGVERQIERSRALQLAADDDEDDEAWAKTRRGLRADAQALRGAIDDATRNAMEWGALMERELGAVMALARDLRSLLHRAAKLPGRAREVLSEMVGTVWVRKLGRYAFSLEIEFPAGGSVRRVLITRRGWVEQTVAAFAYSRLRHFLDDWARGDTGSNSEMMAAANAVAAEINKALRHTKTLPPFTGWRVLGAALLHAYADAGVPRNGAQETLRELAARTQEPEEALLRLAFFGHFGPASVTPAGEIALAPEAAELHRHCHAFARREVARRVGWPESDIAGATDLAKEFGMFRQVLMKRCDECGALRRDEAGFWYLRRSVALEFRPVTIAEAVARADPKFQALEPEYWMYMQDALRMRGGGGRETILKYAPHFKPGVGPNGARSILVWFGPGVLAKLTRKIKCDRDKPGQGVPVDRSRPHSHGRAREER